MVVKIMQLAHGGAALGGSSYALAASTQNLCAARVTEVLAQAHRHEMPRVDTCAMALATEGFSATHSTRGTPSSPRSCSCPVLAAGAAAVMRRWDPSSRLSRRPPAPAVGPGAGPRCAAAGAQGGDGRAVGCVLALPAAALFLGRGHWLASWEGTPQLLHTP